MRVAESNQQVVNSQIEKEKLDFMQNIFLCVQNFNHQPKQLQLAKEVDSIARSRYNTTVEAFIQGKMDILNLNDSQTSKDSARRNYIEQMYMLWSYYYQIREPTAGGTVSDLTDPFFLSRRLFIFTILILPHGFENYIDMR